MKTRITVSNEMLTFVGTGAIDRADWPADALLMRFELGEDGAAPTLACSPAMPFDDMAALARSSLVLVVARAACRRIFARDLDTATAWYLGAELRAQAIAVRDCEGAEPMRTTLRLARSIELLCAIFDLLGRGAMVPVDGEGELAERDIPRIVAARRMVDERWREKLTLDEIARACGLNRGKLTRGFRALYSCSVGDALAERRLAGAQRLLQATDLPVSAIGYRCGYLNNASFTRAFARRFGVAPTRFRAAEAA